MSDTGTRGRHDFDHNKVFEQDACECCEELFDTLQDDNLVECDYRKVSGTYRGSCRYATKAGRWVHRCPRCPCGGEGQPAKLRNKTLAVPSDEGPRAAKGTTFVLTGGLYMRSKPKGGGESWFLKPGTLVVSTGKTVANNRVRHPWVRVSVPDRDLEGWLYLGDLPRGKPPTHG